MMLNWEAFLTLAVVISVIFILARDIMRADITMLLALSILLTSGILSIEEAFSGFSSQAVLTVAALFIVAAGIQKTGGLSFLEKLLSSPRQSVGFLLFRVMGISSLLSAFLNNIPIVAMLIPLLQRLAAKSNISVSKILIPLSYAAIVGGTITLIGTSTNLIISSMLIEYGYEPLRLFELAWIGIPATILVLLFFVLGGHRLLPDRNSDRETENSFASYQFDLKVMESSQIAGKNIEEAGFRALDKAFLSHIQRGKYIIGPVGPEEVIQAGDILTFTGDISIIDSLLQKKGIERVVKQIPAESKVHAMPLYEAVLAPSSFLTDKTLKEANFREHYQGIVLGINRRNEKIRGAIANIPLKAGDLLLIEAKAGFEKKWNNNKDEFYLLSRRDRSDVPLEGKSGLSLMIMIVMVLLAAFNIIPIVIAAFAAALLMILTGCVLPSELRHSVNFPVLLVIAAALGVGKAIDTTGLADMGAAFLLEQTSDYGVIALIISLYLMTAIMTELITNNAAAVLMFPIAIVTAQSQGIDPHALAVTVAIAASASFLTPIGYQTNLMVMSAGAYKFSDYFRAGIVVTIILLIVTVVMVNWLWL